MKKFFAILLTLCLLGTLFVAPVSAAASDYLHAFVDKDEMKIISHYYSYGTHSGLGSIEEYPLSNLIDNDTSTLGTSAATFTSDAGDKSMSGGSFTIDLGKEYPITSVNFAVPSTANQTTFKSSLSDYTGSVSNLTYNHVYVSNSPMTGYNAGYGNNKISVYQGYHNKPNMTSDILDGVNEFRYIHVLSAGNTNLFLCGEISVKYALRNDEKETSATLLKYNVTHNSDLPTVPQQYDISNILDGDPETTALIANYKYNESTEVATFSITNAVIDLGETKKIKTIKVNGATSDQITALKGLSTSYSTVNSWTAGNLLVSNEAPYLSAANTFANCTAVTNNANRLCLDTFTVNGEYRYIAFQSSGNSYPMLLQDIEITFDDREASFETAAKVGDIPVANYGIYYNSSYTPYEEYPISNLFDNDPNTIGWIGAHDSSNGHRAATMVIDLGEAKTISDLDWDMVKQVDAAPIVAEYGIEKTDSTEADSEKESWNGASVRIRGTNTAPTFNASGTVTISDYKDLSTYNINGWREDYVNATALQTPYRYIAISTSDTSFCLMSKLQILDENGNDLMQAKETVMRFYVTPTIKGYATPSSFGMYIVPFDILDKAEADETLYVTGSMTGEIATGDTFSLDLNNIPEDGKDMKIYVKPYVVLDEEVFWSNGLDSYSFNDCLNK